MTTTIVDLPIEVLELIYADLDLQSLYFLSKLNRHLHHTALPCVFRRLWMGKEIIDHGELCLRDKGAVSRYFSQNDDSDTESIYCDANGTYFEGSKRRPSTKDLTPVEFLSAVHGALFLADDSISAYNIQLPTNSDDISIWLRALKDIMNRMNECKEVDIGFGKLDRCIRAIDALSRLPTGGGPTSDIFEVGKWRDRVLTMLEVAVRKGCEDLTVSGGEWIVESYSDPDGKFIDDLDVLELQDTSPSSNPPFAAPDETINDIEASASLTRRFSRLLTSFKDRFQTNQDEPTPQPPESPLIWLVPWPQTSALNSQLRWLSFRESLLLLPPFRSWTVHLLSNSPRLTTLAFTAQPISTSEWDKILLPIHLPSLTRLELKDVNISFKTLSFFLTRHASTLVNLTLYTTPVLYSMPMRSKSVPRRVLEVDLGWTKGGEEFVAHLPDLQDVLVTPLYFLWLMNQPCSGSVNSLTSAPAGASLAMRFPRLKEVTLTTDSHERSIGKGFSLVDRALRALALFIDSFDTHTPPEGPSPAALQSPLASLFLQCRAPSLFQSYLWKYATPPASLAPASRLRPIFGSNQGADVTQTSTTPIAAISPISRATINPTTSPSLLKIAPTLPTLRGIRTLRVGSSWQGDFSDAFIGYLLTIARNKSAFPDLKQVEVLQQRKEHIKTIKDRFGGSVKPTGIACWDMWVMDVG